MLTIQLSIAGFVLVLNLGLLLWLLKFYPVDARGIGTFVFGNCQDLNLLNGAAHAVLNIVSSLFLASGNYCMQILVAPSRVEIDKAEKQGRSLEVGVPSIKNLQYIGWDRTMLWLLIGAMSTLLHLFWNSTLFTSIPVFAIPRAVATSDFLVAPDNWTLSDPLGTSGWWAYAPGYGELSHNLSLIYDLQVAAPTMKRLEPAECIDKFIDPLTVSASVIVVAQNMTSAQFNGTSLLDGWVSGWESWTGSTSWICSAYMSPEPDKYRICNDDWTSEFKHDWQLNWHSKWWIKVDHCLVDVDESNTQDKCGFHYSMHIWAMVCACSALEAAVIFVVWLKNHRMRATGPKKQRRTLVTIGDAIQSFLEHPDFGDDSDHELSASRTTRTRKSAEIVTVKRMPWHVTPRLNWFAAISKRAWLLSYTFFIAGLAVPTISIAFSWDHLRRVGIDMSFKAIWARKFSVFPATTTNRFGPLDDVPKSPLVVLLANVLVANSPQLLMSVLYLFYNNILTRQLLADEWLRFFRRSEKKPLRVSSPKGIQRSSYSLSLPLKYSVPLLACTTLLHWLLSQSIFLVQTSAFQLARNGGHRQPEYDATMRGYSMLGSLLSVGLALLLLLAITFNATLRSYRDIPAAAAATADGVTAPRASMKNLGLLRLGYHCGILRALCAERPAADVDAHLFPLGIGMVETAKSKAAACRGQLVFSTDIQLDQAPVPGELYLVPTLELREPRPGGAWHIRASVAARETVRRATAVLGIRRHRGGRSS
ncbi:uncharacterized protein B0I36DRAFT_295925 [Microdochium trichocladiopsis]|uniref:DUF6536 domain-containing protein n=1 Tax=Microdochium trichocladiopsis TaxID=1682393 RepID=A0A9P9BM62_9PEZI|nr:uncharacterized protein B0I36DRAFT_295925 [Microdochium trichocladiopsis]KAH7025135.1 hypothetical protein B0I36DRAFT_295925 [Microdochium trichocladiopsis]